MFLWLIIHCGYEKLHKSTQEMICHISGMMMMCYHYLLNLVKIHCLTSGYRLRSKVFGLTIKILHNWNDSFSLEGLFLVAPVITLYPPHALPVVPLRCRPGLEVLGCLGPHKIVMSYEMSFLDPTPLPVQKRLFSLLQCHNTSPLSDISYSVITTCL